ncbi:hypothetical protein GCM10009087_30770 [Sphingomonas oligophenolica]
MIDMRMRQDDRIDIAGIECEGTAVQRLQRPRTLKQTAVDEDALSTVTEFHARARDGARRAMESKGESVRHVARRWLIHERSLR